MAFGVSSSAAKGRREAAHYRDSRALLAEAGLTPHTVLLISKPHTERRPYATTRLVWPEVEPVCTSERLKFEAYIESIGDARLVLDMFVETFSESMCTPSKALRSSRESRGRFATHAACSTRPPEDEVRQAFTR